MPDLSIQVQDVGGVSVVSPDGFINAHTVRQFEASLEDLVTRGRFLILIDCENLSYISSAGLGAIMGLIENVRERGGDILLAGLRDNVFTIFDTLGFTQLYRVFSSAEDALASLSGKA